jgi:hypothetical protein
VYKLYLNSVDSVEGISSDCTFNINWRSPMIDPEKTYMIGLESLHLNDDNTVKIMQDIIYTVDINQISTNIFSSKNNRTSSSIALVHGLDYQAYSSKFGSIIADVQALMLGQFRVTFVNTVDGKILTIMDLDKKIEWSAVFVIYKYDD